jgi:hypothetical protein
MLKLTIQDSFRQLEYRKVKCRQRGRIAGKKIVVRRTLQKSATNASRVPEQGMIQICRLVTPSTPSTSKRTDDDEDDELTQRI